MRPSPTVYRSFITVIVILLYCVNCGDGVMRCLVSRPGYGLVSEDCPTGTVGCRIRVETNEAIGFYAYSPLYDRNQFVCMMRNELYSGGDAPAGCMRKKYGGVRCWCYGHSDCNTVEEGRRLYEAFLVDEVDDASHSESSTAITTFTDIPSVTVVSSTLSTSSGTTLSMSSTTTASSIFNSKTPTETSTFPLTKLSDYDITTVPVMVAKDYRTTSVAVPSTSMPTIPSIQPVAHRHRPHKQKHRPHGGDRPKHRPTEVPSPAIVEADAHRRRVAPQSMRSEFDATEGVHVIHVNARDQYDQLIASPEFAGILSRYANDGPARVEVPKLAAVPIRNAPSWAQRNALSKAEGLVDSDENLLTFSGASARRRAPSGDDSERARHYYANRAVDRTDESESTQNDVSLEMRPLSDTEMARHNAAAAYDRRNAGEPRRRHGAVRNAGKAAGGLDEFFDEAFLSAGGRPSITMLVVALTLLFARFNAII